MFWDVSSFEKTQICLKQLYIWYILIFLSTVSCISGLASREMQGLPSLTVAFIAEPTKKRFQCMLNAKLKQRSFILYYIVHCYA